jgi:hypothetical protein
MDFMTSAIVVLGFALVICLCIFKTVWDLSKLSAHDSPVFPETSGKSAVEPYVSSRTELGDTS